MPLTLNTKVRLLKVYRLCEMLVTHYEIRDYEIVIDLLHKIAHEHIKVCEREMTK
jgi:hypothetical protein